MRIGGGKGGKGAWAVMAVVREVGEGALALAFWNILWGGFFPCLCRYCKAGWQSLTVFVGREWLYVWNGKLIR